MNSCKHQFLSKFSSLLGGHVYALSRSRLDVDEAPKGKRLEAIKQMMLRVHRAAGHPGFSNLQRLLEARGSPRWAIELAGDP